MCNGMDTNVQFKRSELLPNGDQYMTDLENVDTDQGDRFTVKVKKTLEVARRIVEALNSEANKDRLVKKKKEPNAASSSRATKLNALVDDGLKVFEGIVLPEDALRTWYVNMVKKRDIDDMVAELKLVKSFTKLSMSMMLSFDEPSSSWRIPLTFSEYLWSLFT